MELKPFISIIIPIYKIPEDFLRKCIESVINQSFKDIEIILVDDESPDNCGEICDEYSNIDSRIKVIHQKNQGVSVARNSGVDNATGEWISFVDADDWIDEDYIQNFYNMTLKTKADILMCDCCVNYSRREVKNKFFKDNKIEAIGEEKDRFLLQYLCSKIYSDDLSTADIGSPWAKIYKREFLIKNNFKFDPKLIRMEDNIFNLYTFQMANTLYYEEGYLYHYRKSEFSGFSRFTPEIVNYYEIVFNELQKFIKKYKKSNEFYIATDVKIIKSIYVYCKMYYFHKDNTKKYTEVNKELKELLNKDLYRNAIKNVKFRYLSSIEKIFVICLKFKMINVLRLLMNIKNLIFK
ncbi:glycosyltransferase family 2 protein [Clostridium nigeriense]|uniref:glycosyltransferase family 2 protein n=1 Tax=Clostridium nigeriense TaxID=1805470 RepID=UPI003D337893